MGEELSETLSVFPTGNGSCNVLPFKAVPASTCCPPVLGGTAGAMPRNMFAVPLGDQWPRVQACTPAMFCLAFRSTDLSAVFTHCATALSFVWVTSQPASYMG